MENKDIHNGLDKKEIRDFLSKMRTKEGNACSYRPLKAIPIIEEQIKELQEQLLHVKNFNAIRNTYNI